MKIRPYSEEDLPRIVDIHKEYYKHEFALTELFDKKVVEKFVITDNNDRIITMVSNRLLLEVMAITDKSYTFYAKKQALEKLLELSLVAGKSNDFQQVHCFAQDDEWVEWLKRYGFKKCKGRALFIDTNGRD